MRHARGQAIVELALGTLVLVTVLTFGLAFAEWGVAVQKVKGSVAFSISTAHGQRTHLFSNGNVSSGDTFSSFNPARAGNVSARRFRDFDPLTPAGTARWTQVMAQARAFTATCRATNDVAFGLQLPGPSHRGAVGDPLIASVFGYLNNRFERRGGVACTSSAQLSLFRLPTRFAEGGDGFFQAAHAVRTTIPMCGIGLPDKSSGACNGELVALTGDWAIEGPMSGGLAELNDDVKSESAPALNRPYRDLVREVWDRNGKDQGNANEEMMQRLTGISGPNQTIGPDGDPWIDTDEFRMSFHGDGLGAQQPNVQPRYLRDDTRLWYQTSGANLESTYVDWRRPSGDVRGVPPCYLGLEGCQ